MPTYYMAFLVLLFSTTIAAHPDSSHTTNDNIETEAHSADSTASDNTYADDGDTEATDEDVTTPSITIIEEDQDWQGMGEFGFINVGGNANSKVLNTSMKLSKEEGNWKHDGLLASIVAESNGVDSAESYLGSYNGQYQLSLRDYVFGDARYLDDKFDSFEEIYTVGGGYGYQVLNKEHIKWDLSVGLAYRSTQREDTRERLKNPAFLSISDFEYQLTSNTSLFDDLRIEATEDNTYIENRLGLQVAMSEVLSLKLGYDIRRNSSPNDNNKKTDYIASVNIIYNFSYLIEALPF